MHKSKAVEQTCFTYAVFYKTSNIYVVYQVIFRIKMGTDSIFMHHISIRYKLQIFKKFYHFSKI